MPYWQRLFSTGYVDPEGNPNVTGSQESAIVSILSAGTFFGSLCSPFLSDYIGRRPGLLLSTWVFNLGVVLHTVATSIPMFLAGRFFAGFGVGLISAISESDHYPPMRDLVANKTAKSPFINPRPLPSGFVASSSALINGLSLLACFLQPLSTMLPRTETIQDLTASQLPFNSYGL